jgi:hypothetical protein
MKNLKWKKSKVFNLVYWYSGFDKGTTRWTFNIDKTSEEYPYRLTMYGNYLGDFKTLKSAQDYAEIELKNALINLNLSKGA